MDTIIKKGRVFARLSYADPAGRPRVVPENDDVHGFGHRARLPAVPKIGQVEGADMEILLTAALLHDAQGSHPGENSRDDHHLRSADFAGEVLSGMGWPTEKIALVQHCIRAHRYRKEDIPESLEAKLLFDADKLDVIGAVGVVRALAYAFRLAHRLSRPSGQFLERGRLRRVSRTAPIMSIYLN